MNLVEVGLVGNNKVYSPHARNKNENVARTNDSRTQIFPGRFLTISLRLEERLLRWRSPKKMNSTLSCDE